MPVRLDGAKRDDGVRFPPEEIDRIVLGDNLRAPVTDESVESLARLIADRGQLQPVVVYRGHDNRTWLAAGYRRVAAIKMINREPERWGLLAPIPLRATLRTLNTKSAIEANLDENLGRSFTTYDKGCALRKLIDVYGYSHGDACARLRVSPTRGSQLLSMLELPDSVLRLVQLEVIAEANARLLRGLPNSQIEALAARLDAGDLTSTGMVIEALRSHKAQGDSIRRPWGRAKALLREDKHPAVAFLEDWFAGDVAEEGLIELFHAIPESAIEGLRERFRIDDRRAA
jgi:ParB/RepB/Spo0J family partition protein